MSNIINQIAKAVKDQLVVLDDATATAKSDQLIKMGQDMMKTPKPSTTTSTCRVTGTGAFKTITCY